MHTSPPVRLAVFDLDGTLVDSRRDLASAANALVRELGGAPLSVEAVGEMVGDGAGVLVHRVLAAAGLDPSSVRATERFLELYDLSLLETTLPYPGIVEALQALSSRMPLAVLTNKPGRATDAILAGLKLAGYFETVIGGDSRFGRKPDPEGLLAIAGSSGVDVESTVMVGDSPIDLETARRAGARICMAAYGFGYRPTELREGELLAHSAAAIASLLDPLT